MYKWFKLLGLALTLVATGATLAEAGEFITTQPNHIPLPSGRLEDTTLPQYNRTKQPRSGSNVILRESAPLLQNWVLVPSLSRACNDNKFRQRRDQYLVGIVGGQAYGAAVGGHSSLIDPGKAARLQVVYLFRGQDTTNCRVYRQKVPPPGIPPPGAPPPPGNPPK